MPDYTVLDLLKYSNEGKPQDFKTAFDDVMRDKISTAIDTRRDEVVDQMFNNENEEEEFDVEDETEVEQPEEVEDSGEEITDEEN